MLRIQPLNNNILRFYLPHVYMFYILRYESCPKKCKIDHVTVHRSKGGLAVYVCVGVDVKMAWHVRFCHCFCLGRHGFDRHKCYSVTAVY